jgi:hypothetical protein
VACATSFSGFCPLWSTSPEASVHCGDAPTPDELYSAEAFYAATAGVRRDLKLLIGYAGRALGQSLVRPRGQAALRYE